MSGRFEGHDPAQGHDTAGVPWAGRTLTGAGFEGDTGAADPQLTAALTDPGDETTVMRAVAGARLLVPVVAVPAGTTELTDTGLAGDASSDMAVVTLTVPDGARALPAFTSQAGLAAWDETARPVPVPAARAAQAAIQEDCQVIVLDPPPPGTPTQASGTAYVLRGSMVWALAMNRPWIPAQQDPQVATAVAAAVQPEPAVAGHDLAGGPDGQLRIGLALRPGLGQQQVRELVTRVGERIAADGEVRARIDAVSFALRRAGAG